MTRVRFRQPVQRVGKRADPIKYNINHKPRKIRQSRNITRVQVKKVDSRAHLNIGRHAPKITQKTPPKNNKIVSDNRVSAYSSNMHSKPNSHRMDVITRRRNKADTTIYRYDSKIKRIKDCGIGKILAIIAPGPSILEADIGSLKNHPDIDLMTINKPDMRVWPTEHWLFCDNSQYKRNMDLFNKYDGLVINSRAVRATHPNQIKIKNISGKGFSRDLLRGYHIGRSSTYAAMQVALWMNYDKIYIFGCDMAKVEITNKDGSKSTMLHSYGKNPDVSDEIRVKRFKEEAKYYHNAAKILREKDRDKFVFCSIYNKWPFVGRFSSLDHRTAADEILSGLGEKNAG